ncbi:MAG: hypothetical protein JWM16_3967, partial [Verrucomicrobiales bacterium]|nr:hypothetical protein [Verrucomicrobiales bacterium]
GGQLWDLTNEPTVLTNVISFAAQQFRNLALREDGTLLRWADRPKPFIPLELRDVFAIAAGQTHFLALAPNLAPAAFTNIASGYANQDLLFSFMGKDPENDMLHFRVWTIPTQGTLYQFVAGERGEAITQPGTWVSDSMGRVIYASPANASGLPLVSIWYDVSDGQYASHQGVTHLYILGAPLVTTKRATGVKGTNAVLNGMVSPNLQPTLAWYEYGTNDVYGWQTPPVSVEAGKSVQYVSTPVQNLDPRSIWHYRLVGSNQFGVTRGPNLQFGVARKVWAWGNQTSTSGGTNVPMGLSNIVDTVALGSSGYALTAEGKIVSWDSRYIPPPLTNATAIFDSVSGSGSFALRDDGTLAVWGASLDGVTNVPAGLSNIVEVAAGGSHAVALRENGTLAVWGKPNQDPIFGSVYGQTNIPPGLSNVVMVACGANHSVALRHNGTVVAWGAGMDSWNYFERGQSIVPVDLQGVVAVAAGGDHSLALKSDGTVVAWGYNAYGQTTVPPGLSNVVRIAAGHRHSLALRKDGTIVAWGATGTNFGVHPNYGQSFIPEGLSNVIAISGGIFHTLAAALNQIPVALSQSPTGFANQDLRITLKGRDMEQDALVFRIKSLPIKGMLFQSAAGFPGNPINAPGIVSDPQGSVIFRPEPGASGNSYATFDFTTGDGMSESIAATVEISLLPEPVPPISTFGMSSNGMFFFSFSGSTNRSYTILGSSNLQDWVQLGMPQQTSNTWFEFLDTNGIRFPQRFYQLRSP